MREELRVHLPGLHLTLPDFLIENEIALVMLFLESNAADIGIRERLVHETKSLLIHDHRAPIADMCKVTYRRGKE